MAKAVNYTTEMLETMISRYTEVRDADQEMRDQVVEDLAAEFGKTEKGIISKLAAQTIEVNGATEKLYRSKVKVSAVTGGEAKKKSELAEVMVREFGLNLVSAVKLNKTDIVALTEYARSVNKMAQQFEDTVLVTAASQ